MNSKNSVLKNNKGASLVLVIVAMMFVAIIASIVLTLTVGNNKSAKATIDTSDNFYASESVLDDLNMYLKKLGTAAATEAYAATLVECSDPAAMKTYFENQYAEKLATVIQTQVLDVYSGPLGADNKYTLDTDFVKNQVAFAEVNDLIKNGLISIKYEEFDTSSYPAVLRGVEISYIDEQGFENTIKTDIIFKANLPKTGEIGSFSPFSYGIDHFVMISGASINPENKLLAQNITGSVYALNNINIKTKTVMDGAGTTDWVNFNSQYVIAGKNINVNGRLSVAPIYLTNLSESAEVWCDNIYVTKKDAEVSTGDSTQDLDTDIYLKGNLELNGKEAKFTAVKGDFYGFSSSDVTYYNPTSGTEKPKSSAIVLNGLGAKLDLSGLSTLNLAGTAYSALPDPVGTGTTDLYNYYNGVVTDEPTKVYYFSQGDSVTVRSLQALYLIPGDFIKGVGHNPMKESEFSSISTGNIDLDVDPALIDGLLNSGIYKQHHVKYVNGEQYVYLFWDFKDTDSAITYFNRASSSGGRYAGLFEKQMSALGSADGEIKLPATVNTTGYAVKYNSSATPKFGKAGKVDTNLDAYSTKYNGLLTTLDKDSVSGSDIISNMFDDFSGDHSKYVKEDFDKKMSGPYTPFVTSEGAQISYTTSDTKRYYKLITGDSVTLNSAPKVLDDSGAPVEATAIIISSGDVELNYSGSFRGMIIAGGNIKINSGLNMECLGMVSRTQKITDAAGNETTEDQVISEFQALLGIAPNDADLSNANSRFREIFGVRDNSFEVGGDDGSNLVVNELTGWARN
jgi:hypothetical protein